VSPRARTFHGWRVVAGAFVLAVFGWGLGFYGPPVFLHAVQAARGWSVALVSAAVTLHFLVGAGVVANLPALYHRFGIPAVTRAGALTLLAGLVGWSLAAAPWQLFLAAGLSGAGWVTMGAAAVNAIVAPWFVRNRPAALAAAYNGASIGGLVFSPLWVAAIAALGFTVAALAIGLTMAAAAWIIAGRLLGRGPEAMGLKPDGDAPAGAGAAPATRPATPPAAALSGRALWRSPRFLTLAAGMALGLFAQIGMVTHLFSLLVPALGAGMAGLAMGVGTGSAILGRMLVVWMMRPGVDRRLYACGNYLVQLTGALVLVAADGASAPLLWLGVLLFGAGIGNATSMPPMIAQTEFAAVDVARVVALIVAMGQATYAFAPAAFGQVRSLDPTDSMATGAAPTFFLAVAAVQAMAILVFFLGRRR